MPPRPTPPEHLIEIEAGGAGEASARRGRRDAGRGDLVDHLGLLVRRPAADMDDPLAISLEDRLGRGECCRAAAAS